MAEDARLIEDIKELKSMAQESLKILVETKTQVATIQARGCESGVKMTLGAMRKLEGVEKEFCERMDKRRNATIIGATVAGAVVAVMEWMRH